MFDYGDLVFLDNQKTGSTYVSVFLEHCCLLQHVKSEKHAVVTDDFRPSAVYFSTVRNPVDVYKSLFRYGAEGRGSTHKHLMREGKLDLYENMSRWIEFMLDEKNAHMFREGYAPVAQLGVGLMSYRAMRITLRDPASVMSKANSYDDLVRLWSSAKIAQHIFRQEKLAHSLLKFSKKVVPEYFNQKAVEAFMAKPRRVNATKRLQEAPIPSELLHRIVEKESFLVDKFYPHLRPKLWPLSWIDALRLRA